MFSFYQNNRSLVFAKMNKGSIALFFSNSSSFIHNINFELDKNFYYLTGIEENNIALLLIKSQNGYEETLLFLKPNNLLKQKWDGENLTFQKASNITSIPLENCLDIDCIDSFLFNFLNTSHNSKYGWIDNVYLDLSKKSMSDVSNLYLNKARYLQQNYPYVKIFDICIFLSKMRTIKNEKEIDLIKAAIAVNDKALREIAKILKIGMYEYQVTAFYHYFLANQALRPSFNTIVAAGKNATILHYNTQKSQIQSNDLVLLDLGVNYNNYASDISVCFPANGKFNLQQKIIYNIVLETNRKIIQWMKPGYTFAEMNKYGKGILSQLLIENGFLGENDKIEKYCYHGLGHYLGLEVHDVGNIYEPIPNNSVITVEPGLYFEEFNLGIRIEDNILIRNSGNINLTESIPRKIEDIENLMQIE
ncbi:aminopeptidase P N-terminal domain-containing protein [Candidatus Phytoplasma fraxini]|uniref:Xaa-Pro aminopeptidase n=1 Tax=Ash yellows phytoplasma TaxID=35780 RepID=A0ABZ2U8D1_ASHYP